MSKQQPINQEDAIKVKSIIYALDELNLLDNFETSVLADAFVASDYDVNKAAAILKCVYIRALKLNLLKQYQANNALHMPQKLFPEYDIRNFATLGRILQMTIAREEGFHVFSSIYNGDAYIDGQEMINLDALASSLMTLEQYNEIISHLSDKFAEQRNLLEKISVELDKSQDATNQASLAPKLKI